MSISAPTSKNFKGPYTTREAVLLEEIGRLKKTVILKDEIIDTYRKVTEDMAANIVYLAKIAEAKHG